ncbi:MAG: TlyA family RNA methyltransferase [Coriobacteriia bacterium]|nr:TlyA family RNA methyltransferase [Coriobacteriia bacterium]
MARSRLDATLADRGLFPSREQARAAVLAGEVRVDGEIVTKAGHSIAETAEIEVLKRPRFVSRGGEKLAGALAKFGVDPAGARAIDVGASTGGFTDCLLQAGAAQVVALDVGYGQLAWSLRTDPRVVVVERTNVRSADSELLGAPFDLVVMDVSFISLRTVFPQLLTLLGEAGDLIVLVKPQFEAGKGRVGKKGVVRNPAVHEDVLRAAVETAVAADLVVRGLTFSPIQGPEGNIEFWMWVAREGEATPDSVEQVVADAHRVFGG